MDIKVRGGTAVHGQSLCPTCAYVSIREGQNGETWVHCSAFGRYVKTHTYKCTEYQHKNSPQLHELKQIAWVITSEAHGPLGFRPFKELNNAEKRKWDDVG